MALALICLLTGCAAPIISPAPPQQAGTIIVVGNGNTRVQANIAQINFTITIVDDNVSAANRAASATLQRIIDTLANENIAGNDFPLIVRNIYAERYYPDYEYDDPGTVPLFPDANEELRYRVIYYRSILVHDLENIPTVVAILADASGNALYINGTDLLYDDPEGLEEEARAFAMADAKRKAEESAKEIGAQLGPPLGISEHVEGFGSSWTNDMAPIWPGQLRFVMQIQVTYAMYYATPSQLPLSLTPKVAATRP